MVNMETRKVQRTGKSTFVVSLPKNWATKNAIDSGSILFLTMNQNGALMLSAEKSAPSLKIEIDIGDRCGDPLIRDIIACYVAGYRTIEVTSSSMSSTQKRDLHQIVNKLIGPEILEETVNKVIIQDLLSSEDLQVERALMRIRTIARSMIQDSINSLVRQNQDLAHDVLQKDNDVDRLNLLIAREFSEILRSGSIKKKIFNPMKALNYMLAASNLERMADHAARIAEVSSEHSCELPDEITSELVHLALVLGSLLDEAVGVLIKTDSKRANEIIDKAGEIRERSQVMANSFCVKGKEEIMVRLVVASSIERIVDYLINIGELTINLCNADTDI
jgi:phosphate uptake regulator